MICEKCGEEDVGDSVVSWCPTCTPEVDILRLSLWALTNSVGSLIAASRGAKLNPGIDAGVYAEPGGLLKWQDAEHSCWLGSLGTAREALIRCGMPEGFPKPEGCEILSVASACRLMTCARWRPC